MDSFNTDYEKIRFLIISGHGLNIWAIISKVWLMLLMKMLFLEEVNINVLFLAIEFAFDVYDFKGDGKVDAFYTGDLMRACNINPTLKTIAEIGGQSEKGKKVLTKAECFPIYKAAKESKDQGGFHDFVEILKLYDKNNDDTMLGHELFRLLTNLGEKLTKEEAKSLMKELCEPEDDEGFMPFKRKFLNRIKALQIFRQLSLFFFRY